MKALFHMCSSTCLLCKHFLNVPLAQYILISTADFRSGFKIDQHLVTMFQNIFRVDIFKIQFRMIAFILSIFSVRTKWMTPRNLIELIIIEYLTCSKWTLMVSYRIF